MKDAEDRMFVAVPLIGLFILWTIIVWFAGKHSGWYEGFARCQAAYIEKLEKKS